jgi:hypothetical protein
MAGRCSRARQLQRSFPHEAQREQQRLAASHKEALADLRWVAERLDAEQRRIEQLRSWQREQIRDALRTIDQLVERRGRAQEAANRDAREHNGIVGGADSPGRWRREHGAAPVPAPRSVSTSSVDVADAFDEAV